MVSDLDTLSLSVYGSIMNEIEKDLFFDLKSSPDGALVYYIDHFFADDIR